MTPEQIQLWLQLGVGGLLLVALLLGAKGTWVFGRTFDRVVAEGTSREAQMRTEINEWKAMALRLLPLAEKSTTVADAVVQKNGTA